MSNAGARSPLARAAFPARAATPARAGLPAWVILAVVTIAAVSLAPAPSARAADLSTIYDSALRGDMITALAALDTIPRDSLSEKDVATADCIRRTFSVPPQSEDLPPKTSAILTAYRQYWQDLMLRRADTATAEARLLEALRGIVGVDSSDATLAGDLGSVSERARQAAEEEGVYALAGVTSPFWEMMIWKKQEPTTYHVKLTDQAINVKVVFLDDFVSLGWAGYATCGRAHTGGWATSDSLLSLKGSYDLNSEDFRVSYLAHEGRHFADYKAFPKLQQPELEYRAKLTELAVSTTTTNALMTTFARRAGKSRTVPHDFANYCVTRDVGAVLYGRETPVKSGPMEAAKWEKVPAERIRKAAQKVLEQNSALLRQKGAARVAQFL